MKKKCLLIDLDDTLFDSESAYAHALNLIGIDPVSSDYTEARKTIKSRLGQGHVGARNRLLYFKQVLEARFHYSHHGLLELMEQYEKHLSDHIKNQWQTLGRKRLFEGKLASVPKVILTNENLRTQMIKLRAIDPEGNLFPHVITSEEMGVEKPHLSLFEKALNVLDAAPQDCAMVGDSLETDIAPAVKLGIRPLLTTEFTKLSEKQQIPSEVQVLNRLEELENIF